MPSLYREGTPPALKRHMKWTWLGLGANLAITLAGGAASLLLASTAALVATSLLGVGVMVAGVAAAIALSLRDRARVRHLHGRACPTCLYDLSTLPGGGHCPECGTPYTTGDIVRQWRDADRSYRAKKLYRDEG